MGGVVMISCTVQIESITAPLRCPTKVRVSDLLGGYCEVFFMTLPQYFPRNWLRLL